MDRRAKDSANYNRDYHQFIQNLQKFHGSRGSGFKRVPFFGGKELDLFLLYKTVTSLGGCAKVTDEKKWREVAKCFNLPASCTNAAFSLRQYYLRYLASYERFHFLGEDADDNSAEMRRAASSSFFQSSVNLFPSNIQEPPRRVLPGPLGEPRVNNFDRLIFSLMSGLPNEVDFALNICTLLSNVTNSIFNLAKAPSIVELMLAHVGIFTEGKVSMRELYKEWYQESDRDFNKFWRESIDDDTVKEVYNSSFGCGESASSIETTNLFSDGASVLNESVEAKRVNQVCVILHNFSYEELNCLFISSHSTCVRFLTLCAGSKLTSLRKTALDALDNVADKISLGIVQDETTQIHLRVLHSFMLSNDRTRKVRALSILAKLSGQQENEDVLSEALPQDVYEELIRCLTIPDIQLILNSLDALYFLSDLGEATATAIAMVYRSVDILVCLVTVHAESYGNRAIAGFRIVENKNSVHAQKHSSLPQNNPRNIALQQMQRSYAQLHPVAQQIPMQQARASPKSRLPINYSPVRPDVQKQDENEEVEPEIFSARWISAFYELAPGSEIKRSQIYADYLESCKELGRKGVLNAQAFFKILGLVIPAPYWRPTDNNDPTIAGIKRRATPLIVKSKSSKPVVRVPDVTSTHSDQSMPVRPIPVMPAVPAAQPQTAVRIPFSIQQSPQITLSTSGGFQGMIQSPKPGLPTIASNTVPTSAMSMPINSQVLPLKLLEQHVNSQGQGKDVPVTGPSSNSPNIIAATTSDQVSSAQQLPQSLASKQPSVQVAGLSQSIVTNPIQTQTVLGSLPQLSQGVLLQGASPGIVIPASGANVASNQNDSNAKLNSQQKLTAKERNERKKAMKAARDMINADIKASNLDPLTQCQNLTERIQKEMQQHFVQFHVHQQSIQAIQAQLQQLVLQNQQSKLPQNIMEDIHTRVRSHHAQMQAHYQKLQQLQILLQQVKIRLSQEQKLKEQTEVSQNSATEGSNQSLSKTPRTPRILRKQIPSGASPSIIQSASQATVVNLQQPQLATSVVGMTQIQQINAGGQLITPIAVQQPQQMMSATAAQCNTTTPTQKTDVITAANAPPPTLLATQVSGIKTETPNQSQSATVPTQVAFIPNTGAVPGQTSGIQLAQAAFSTPGKQVGAPVLQKPVSVTYNTPILPRPSTSILNLPQQNVPTNSAMVGQAMLLTVPVVALPQQEMQQSILSRIPQSQAQHALPTSTCAIETTLYNSINSTMVQSDVANTTSTEQLLTAGQDSSEVISNSNPVFVNSESNSKCAPLTSATVLRSTISQGIVTSPVVMANVQSQNSLFNGPIKTDANVKVNGEVENGVGKCLPDAQALKNEGSQNVTENSKENGLSLAGNTLSLRGNLKQQEKGDLSETNRVSKSKAGLVNGDYMNVNGDVDVDKKILTTSETNKKRKFSDSSEHDAENGKFNKTDDNEVKLLGDVKDDDSILIEKYDTVIKNNKKLKMNGIYVNNSREKSGDDSETEILASSDRDGNGESSRQPHINGVTNDQSPTYQSDTASIGDNHCEISESVKKSEIEIPSSKTTIESTDTLSRDTDVKSPDTKCDVKQGKEKEKHAKGRFNCQWANCKGFFSSSSDLLAHMVVTHAPQEGSLKVCKVSGCKSVQRPRGSMICHFSQVHCNSSTVAEDEQVTLPQLLFPKVVDVEREDESPVTRSVRLTAALVLRNIARNSSYGRKVIMKYESRLTTAAMSSSEASSAVAACLEELTRKRRKPSDCSTEEEYTS